MASVAPQLLGSNMNFKGKVILSALVLSCMVTSLWAFAEPSIVHPPKIIGGTNASEGEFPFIVSLQMRPVFGEGYHYCAGVISSPNNVFTAAHCIYGRLLSQIHVIAGAHNLHDPSNEPSLQIRNVTLALTHPQFDPNTLSNDFAILMLSSPLDLTSSRVTVAPFPPQNNSPVENGTCTFIGWGSSLDSDFSKSLQTLQKLNLTAMSPSTCQSYYEYIKPIDPSTQICADSDVEGPSYGDTGGPLICNDPTQNEDVVFGIFSWKMSSYPSIFTKISIAFNFNLNN